MTSWCSTSSRETTFTLLRFTAYGGGAIGVMCWLDRYPVHQIAYPRETALAVGVVAVAAIESAMAGHNPPPRKGVDRYNPNLRAFLQELMKDNYRYDLTLEEVIEQLDSLAERLIMEKGQEVNEFWQRQNAITINVICDVAKVAEAERPGTVLGAVGKLMHYLSQLKGTETPPDVLSGLGSDGDDLDDVKADLTQQLFTPTKRKTKNE